MLKTKGEVIKSNSKNNAVLICSLVFFFLIFVRLYISFVDKNPISDFFDYYKIAELFFSGTPSYFQEPLLFPILLYLFKSFFTVFLLKSSAYLLGARLISFSSVFFSLYFIYKIICEFTDKNTASVSIFILLLYPKLLIIMSYEISDSFFLAFSLWTIWLFVKKDRLSLITAFIASFIRFEGILLIFSYMINYIQLKLRNLKYLLLSLFAIGSILFLFLKFTLRFYYHLQMLLMTKKYLFYLSPPTKVLILLYKDFFFFLPVKLFYPVKMFLMYAILVFIVLGLHYLFKKDKRIAILFLFILLSMLLGKGASEDIRFPHFVHKMHLFLFLSYILFAIGTFNFYNLYKNKFHILKYYLWSIYGVLCYGLFFFLSGYFYLYYKYIIIFLPYLMIIILLIKKYKEVLVKKILITFILIFISFGIFIKSMDVTSKYLFSAAHNSLPLIAKWIKKNTIKEEKILAVLYYWGLNFYFTENREILRFPFQKYKYKSPDELLELVYEFCRKNEVKYLVMENYTRPKNGPVKAKFQGYLFNKKHYEKYFKLVKIIVYRKHVFGLILKPIKKQI
jgi:hypothetical protein